MNPSEKCNEELKDMVEDVVKNLDSQIRELKITKAMLIMLRDENERLVKDLKSVIGDMKDMAVGYRQKGEADEGTV